ncbi:hypothetical protein LT493_30165 [Streptomyces tricolor]|nr:hypothetical protein [Streptomyces tricolor]
MRRLGSRLLSLASAIGLIAVLAALSVVPNYPLRAARGVRRRGRGRLPQRRHERAGRRGWRAPTGVRPCRSCTPPSAAGCSPPRC